MFSNVDKWHKTPPMCTNIIKTNSQAFFPHLSWISAVNIRSWLSEQVLFWRIDSHTARNPSQKRGKRPICPLTTASIDQKVMQEETGSFFSDGVVPITKKRSLRNFYHLNSYLIHSWTTLFRQALKSDSGKCRESIIKVPKVHLDGTTWHSLHLAARLRFVSEPNLIKILTASFILWSVCLPVEW